MVAHPFVMIAVLSGTAAAHAGESHVMASDVGIIALFAILPVAILTMIQVRRGAWSNADASHPRERPILYAVGITGILALVCCLSIIRPHSVLLRGALAGLGLLLVCAATTRWIKVSLHVTAAALTATALSIHGSPVGWIVAGILPILAWSRLALGRHKPIELALGLGLGVVAGVAMRFP